MKWVFKAKKIASLPLKAWDYEEVECFSYVNIYHGANGHVYYSYTHSDWEYCPLHNVPIENCPYGNEKRSCQNCPDAKDFIVLEGQEDLLIPVNRLT